jgi:hypothetical protein
MDDISLWQRWRAPLGCTIKTRTTAQLHNLLNYSVSQIDRFPNMLNSIESIFKEACAGGTKHGYSTVVHATIVAIVNSPNRILMG